MDTGEMVDGRGEFTAAASRVASLDDLARLLRRLRRREARRRGGPELSYRQLAATTGWAHGAIGQYLTGRALPPTDRFDTLIRLLGATPAEQRALATARDAVADRRRVRPNVAVPMELPPEVFGFTGRGEPQAGLDRLLAADPTMGVALIAGTAGVGKTALAVHWAHRVADRFPDGQLYLDLRGYGPGRPVSAGQALAAMLHSLGVTGQDLPADVARRAARYRSVVAGRRLLVVLDNALSADQVRPLLPGSAGCFVVVTSRDDLSGLVARDGARRVELDPLPPADAVRLLGTLIGSRVHAEPAAAAALAERCARLPLALRVAAELVAARAEESLADLVDELTDQRRLELLDAGVDARSGVRSTFSWSLRHLPAGAAAAFRLLGLHPGQDVDAPALAALVGVDAEAARQLLGRLERAHLVERGRPGRYRMHDLLRAYAREQAPTGDTARAALTRLFDRYLDTAVRAAGELYPHERERLPPAGRWEHGPAEALAWLDAERANLVAVCAHAARHGWSRLGTDLSRALWRYLDSHGHYQEALAVHGDAAAGAAPGSNAEAEATTYLGMTHWRLGDCAVALDLLRRALAVHRAVGRPADQARVLANLGIVSETVGRYDEALEHHRQALTIYADVGDRHRQAIELNNVGAVHCRLGDHARAIEHHRRAAALGREIGDPHVQGYALGNLGLAYQQLGHYREALRSQRPALASSRRFGDRRGEAEMLRSIGVTYARLDRVDEAVDHLHQALALTRELRHRNQEAQTRNDLGDTLRTVGRPADALAHHTAALAIADEIGDPHERARAFDGMAEAHHLLGHPSLAGRYWSQALTGYAELGLPEAGRLRARLDGLSSSESPQPG